MAALDQLNTYLSSSSYLGSATGVTLEDYRQCKEIKEGSVSEKEFPHLFRWYTHVSYLMDKYPEVDYRGNKIPAGTVPALTGGAPQAAKKDIAPKKEAAPKKRRLLRKRRPQRRKKLHQKRGPRRRKQRPMLL